MVKKNEKQSNSVIDNSKNFQVIIHSLYWTWDRKTGKVKEVCRTEKGKTN
jgi:hypothetical protein